MDAFRGAPALAEVVRPVTFIESRRLSERLGATVTLASETFQHTGSFKFRAAYNLAAKVPERMIVTASSGNFGQALACACAMLDKRCIVVMPATSVKVKIAAVREYGAAVEFVDVRVKSRAARVAEVAGEHPGARVASAYDDPLVIEGNASLGRELAAAGQNWDCVVVPVGGGGLSAGIITGLRLGGAAGPGVVGAEPLLGNDAARSLRAGHIVANPAEPATIADGARTLSLGVHNWAILQNGLERIVEAPEERIREAVRLLFELANLKAEPTGALGVAALLSEPDYFAGRRVCCVVSGGNADPELYRELIGEQ